MPNKPKGLSCLEDVLSPQQLGIFPPVCGSPKDKFIVYFLVFAGPRVSELKHLRRSWGNPEEETIASPMKWHCDCGEYEETIANLFIG